MLASAIANAEHNKRPQPRRRLWISEAYVDEGPTLKRFRPRAQGRAYRIRKRTSHITVVVESRDAVAGTDREEDAAAKTTAKKTATKKTTAKKTRGRNEGEAS